MKYKTKLFGAHKNEKWQTLTLSEAGVTLIDCLHSTPSASDYGYPYITIPQIKNNRVDISTARLIDHENFVKWTEKALPQENDVILSRRCNPGVTALIPSGMKCAIGQNLVLLRSDGKKIFPPFLHWLVRGEEWWIQIKKFLNVGAIFDSLRCGDIPNFSLTIPSLHEQYKISFILDTLENKIENLQNQNKILEQIIQTIFKSWFIDFDGQTEFVDSELGQIPKGWQVKKIGDFISIEKGLSYKGKFLSSSGTPLINLGNIEKNGGFIETKIKHYVGEYKTKHVIHSGDIVIANTDITQDRLVLGSPAFIPPLETKEIIFTHHIFAVRNNSDLKNYFLYNLLKTQSYHESVISYATGTTVLAVPKESVLDFRFAFSNNDLINKFEKIASNIHQSFFRNNSITQALTKTRDVLFPKLMSGEIRV